MSRSHSFTMPPPARWLGVGGVLPFAALALATVLDPVHSLMWQQALMAYGAIILSFVGALHWGFAMTAAGLDERERSQRFVWSVMPALIGWTALLALTFSVILAVGLLLLGFWLHLLQDRVLVQRAELPRWYMPLRLGLTTAASVAIIAGGWAAL